MARLRSLLFTAVLVPVVLALAACAPAVSPISPSPSVSAILATPTPAPTSAPVNVDPADFLVGGTPLTFDTNGEWFGHYAFYTDATKSVHCDLTIFSGDAGAIWCTISKGSESLRTFTIPSNKQSLCGGTGPLGLEITVKSSQVNHTADYSPDCVAAGSDGVDKKPYDPPVLGDNQTLNLTGALTPTKYTCTVHNSVATCSIENAGTITFGLAVATFSG